VTGFLPYSRQEIDEADVERVVRALQDDLLTTGPRVAAFEEAICAATGAKFAAACSSGTAALHIAALALGLGPGDQVIVPAVTFLATANAPHMTGAEIVFADVDQDSGLMTPDTLREALTRAPRAKAVFPVHMNGSVVDMQGLSVIARERGLAVVEDACHALAATLRVGSADFKIGDCAYSDMAVFSFHPVKAVTTGEGGATVTNDPKLAERLKLFRNHGMTKDQESFENRDYAFAPDGTVNPWYYEMREPAYNYRLSDVMCALGIGQIDKLADFIGRRRRLAALYDSAFESLTNLLRPVEQSRWGRSAYHLYPVLIDFAAAGLSRAEVMRALFAANIGTQVHYFPVHLQPYYRKMNPALSLPGAMKYYDRVLSLPLFPAMQDGDVERVVGALENVLSGRAIKITGRP
jgi:UDP-4-amino-4,6-dideoxy-N-acetyl-beta-L-altrosamine transaminase